MMEYALLASGSKGNCFLLKDEGTTIQIDCGTTQKYLKECFNKLNHDVQDTDALFITHDHSDHISQIKMFKDLTVYSPVEIEQVDTMKVTPNQPIFVNNLKVTPIALSHDALNTVGYVIEDGIEKLVYVTDTGYLNQKYYPLLRDADYIVMESNHDISMLMQTRRPHYVKARINSDNGHLNNEACAEALTHILTKKTKQVILAHISREGNTSEKALEVNKEILLSTCKDKFNDQLIVSSAKQFEMIIRSNNDEETYPGSTCWFAGMECSTNH